MEEQMLKRLKRLRDKFVPPQVMGFPDKACQQMRAEASDAIRKLVIEIPGSEVRVFVTGSTFCVQITIRKAYNRLNIPMDELIRSPEELISYKILDFLRHATVVVDYHKKCDAKPNLPK
jgi:hypothetical protein